MSDPVVTDLDRMISRYLDDESSSTERRELQRRLARDSQAEALFEDYSNLDREVRNAMRRALGRSLAPARPLSRWRHVGQYVGLAIAACIATLFWLRHAPHVERNGGEATKASVMNSPSWFAPLPPAKDSVRKDPGAYGQPGLGLTGTDRHWIVLPGKTPDQFIVIEVNRVHSKYIPLKQDF